MVAIAQALPVLPMTQDRVKRRKLPNMAWLDMSTLWHIRRWEHTARVTASAVKWTLDSADAAIKFAEKAFGFHGWDLVKGSIRPDPKRELHIEIVLVFMPRGTGDAELRRVL